MNEEKRNLLFVCMTVVASSVESSIVSAVKEEVKKKLQFWAEGKLAKLHCFRTKPNKVYLVWYESQKATLGSYVYVEFNIRLKSPYDTDYIIPEMEQIKNVVNVKTSWFPSRESYGGTIQKDGSVIETWDI